MEKRRVLTTALAIFVALLLIVAPIWYCASMEISDVYIVDKGYSLSYIDEYAFIHDDVFWFVCGDSENNYTVFVNPYTWYRYSVGEKYTGSMGKFLIYEGDDSIARYLNEMRN